MSFPSANEYVNAKVLRTDRFVFALFYRNKSKFWFTTRPGEYHRLDGPAVIDTRFVYAGFHYPMYADRLWFYNDREVSDVVYSWCESRGCDIEDLSETEILLMWSEIR